METLHGIIIIGARITGLATALGLHRMGIQSLVLESASELRVTGFVIGAWTNAWRALDALGIGYSLRVNHQKLEGIIASSTVLGSTTAEMSLKVKGKNGDHELRCLRRRDLLETLADELPKGTVWFGAKVVSIDDETDHFNIVHLAERNYGGEGSHTCRRRKKPACSFKNDSREDRDNKGGRGSR